VFLLGVSSTLIELILTLPLELGRPSVVLFFPLSRTSSRSNLRPCPFARPTDEARGVCTPAGRAYWDAKQISRLLAD
jgi:hypothetical protein